MSGLEFNPNIRANGLQGKQVYKAEDAATLERTEAPVFGFRTQKTELMPELKPVSVKRIEMDTQGHMQVITSSMSDPVTERKNALEFKETVTAMVGFDYTKYDVGRKTALHAAMNPFLA